MTSENAPGGGELQSAYDVVVVGSGAGGLLAALVAAKNHAEVLVVEKDRQWGGTSATSGGGIWINGTGSVIGCTIQSNVATWANSGGGGIFASN